MTKALFFDIDGTLVSFDTHLIPQSAVDALTEAKAGGTEIYISTGRPYPIINNIGAISHLVDGYITTNGAYCFIGEREVSCEAIPEEDVARVIEYSRTMGFPCIVVGERMLTMFNTASDPEAVAHVARMLNVPGIEKEYPLEALSGQRILQLTPFISEAQEREIMETVAGVESGRWCPEFADFTAKGISKAKGLADIASCRGFDISETMAFGDGGNDLSIIRAAGIGVAMGNANPELKEAADYITASVDEDGVSKALRHFGVIS